MTKRRSILAPLLVMGFLTTSQAQAQVPFFSQRETPVTAEAAAPPPVDTESQLKIFQLKYLPAESLLKTLQSIFREEGVLFAAEMRTNSLIVRGARDKLAELEPLILALDVDHPPELPFALQERLASPPLPILPNVENAPGNPESAALAQNYAQLNQRTTDLAADIRRMSGSKGLGEQQLDQLKDQLRSAVTKAFEARQQLQQAEAAALRERLAHVERMITSRETIKRDVIDRRVEDLLNPARDWENQQANSAATTPELPGPVAILGGQDQAAAPGSLPLPGLRIDVPTTSINTQKPAGLILRTPDEFHRALSQANQLITYGAKVRRSSPEEIQVFKFELDRIRNEYEAQLKMLELELSSAQEAANVARDAAQRLEQLGQNKAVTQSEVRTQQRDAVQAHARVEQLKTLLDLYRQADPKREAGATPGDDLVPGTERSSTPPARPALEDKPLSIVPTLEDKSLPTVPTLEDEPLPTVPTLEDKPETLRKP